MKTGVELIAEERLKKSLSDVIDATEDKNGQFRAWHDQLRKTTKAAKEGLSSHLH